MDQSTTFNPITVWQGRIDSWIKSGTSIAKWCKEHQVSYDQFIYHKNKLSGNKRKLRIATPKFIELADATPDDPGITIECGDVKIRLTSNFDEEALLRCVQVVRKVI